MRLIARVFVATILANLVLALGFYTAAQGANEGPRGVMISNASDSADRDVRTRLGGRTIGPGVLAASVDELQLGELRRRYPNLRIEPDLPVKAAELPNDPCVRSCNGTNQWYLSSIRASEAWGTAKGAGITIAVLDTGVDPTHPDLVGKMESSIDVTASLDGPGPHGTAVAGIAAASTDNALGVAGIGWSSRILSVKVLDSLGSGLASSVVNGIYEAVLRGARVINLSLTGSDSLALKDAVDYAVSQGVAVVAAAGNQGVATPSYPAAYPNVLSVGAVGSDGVKASFSNYGNWVDLYAPGVNLYTTTMGASIYANFTGTSAATPIVSGVAALLIAQGINASPNSIEARLIQTGVAMTESSTWRRLDAGAALTTAVTSPPLGAAVVASRLDPYPGFPGGVNTAYGDVDGDGQDEMITGAGPGGGPHVLALEQDGSIAASFFAYSPSFTGGVDVGAGDVDGDGKDEIITGAGPGGGPHVLAFKQNGSIVSSFFAYSPSFTGGVDIGAGDVDGDGRDEIITGAGPGGGPHVLAFKQSGSIVSSFFAYDPGFTGGVSVSAGDRNLDGKDDIITGAGRGGGPHVRVFSGGSGQEIEGFLAFSSFFGGVDVAGSKGLVAVSMLRQGSAVLQKI